MKYEHELEMLRLSKSSLQRSVEQLESELKVSRLEVASLKEVVTRMTADASAIQCRLDATRVSFRLKPASSPLHGITTCSA